MELAIYNAQSLNETTQTSYGLVLGKGKWGEHRKIFSKLIPVHLHEEEWKKT